MRASNTVDRSTAFQFTINNYTDNDIEKVRELSNKSIVKKIVVGKEQGESGTPHLQGYVQFDKRQFRRNVSLWLGGRAHIENAFRSPHENYRYCTKEGNILINQGFQEIEKSLQREENTRKKRDEAAAEILHDIYELSEAEFIKKHTYFYLYKQKEYRAFKCNADQLKLPNYDGELNQKNYWIYGDAGTGKSKLADQWSTPEKILRKTNNKWFDGYSPDLEFIIIDDITPNLHAETARTIKNLADRYKFIVEIKNGTRVISASVYKMDM